MKKILLSTLFTLICSLSVYAQSTLKGAENFSISLPNQWQRTLGANDLASVQWENKNDEIYGYVIFENIDEIKLLELTDDISSITNYADLSTNDFSDLPKFKKNNSTRFKTTLGLDTEQREISYYNDELDVQIVMFINIYKSEHFIYKMINFGTKETIKKGKKDIDYIINNFKIQ